MSKCEVFEHKQTKWTGLWYHPEIDAYTSPSLNLAVFKKFKGTAQIWIRKNSNWNGGENNRPYLNFTIREANSKTPVVLEIESESHDETIGLFIARCSQIAEENWCPSQVTMLKRLFKAALTDTEYSECELEEQHE